MAIINVDDAYILNEAGAQVDKTTGIPFKNESLTKAEAAQARANIRAGGSNRNLLDNWYFVGGGSQLGDGVFPINQRGQTSYGGGGTTNIDRWWTQYDTATTLTSAGMRMTGKWDVDQRLPQVLPSGTYTFSVNVVSLGSTGAILQFLDENYQQLASAPLNNEGITSFTLTSDRIRGVGVNMAKPDGSGDITFASMKLEAGTVSTLANDPPPDFGEELRKCQRYFTRLKTGIQHSIFGTGVVEAGNIVACAFELPTVMRVSGTASAVVNNLYGYDGSNTYTVSGVYAFRQSGATPIASVWCGVTATAGTWLQIRGNDGSAYIDISADL